jgi:hypothetical protein
MGLGGTVDRRLFGVIGHNIVIRCDTAAGFSGGRNYYPVGCGGAI